MHAACRLLFGAFDVDTNGLLGTAITKPIRVFANNDVARGTILPTIAPDKHPQLAPIPIIWKIHAAFVSIFLSLAILD